MNEFSRNLTKLAFAGAAILSCEQPQARSEEGTVLYYPAQIKVKATSDRPSLDVHNPIVVPPSAKEFNGNPIDKTKFRFCYNNIWTEVTIEETDFKEKTETQAPLNFLRARQGENCDLIMKNGKSLKIIAFSR